MQIYNFFLTDSGSGPIDYKKLLRDEILNKTKEKITVNLPTIVKENSIVHKNSPFTFSDKDMVVTIRSASPVEVSNENLLKLSLLNAIFQNKAQVYTIQNLIQLKLVPIMIENAQRQVAEEFKSMILKPLYIDANLNKAFTECDFRFSRSDYRKCLNSVACVIATQQEGYLYYFDDRGKI